MFNRSKLAGAVAGFLACAVAGAATMPATEVRPVTDEYHGVKAADPYRWLEDAADPKVVEWNRAQGAYAHAWLDALPARASLKKKLTKLITETSPSFSGLHPAGEMIFAFYNDPKFQQAMLVALPPSANPSEKKVVLDPNKLDTSGQTAIDWFVPSHDGKRVAVSLSKGGSENGTLHLYDVASGKEAGETIPRVQYPTAGGSLAWAADGKSFCYTRYPGEERAEEDRHFYMQVYRHALGSDWQKDPLVLGTDDGIPRIGEVFLDNGYAPDILLTSVQNGDGGEWAHWLIDADGKKAKLDDFKDKVVAATVAPDHSVYLISRNRAPNGKVMKLAAGETQLSKARTIIKESKAAIVVSDGDTPRPPTLAGSAMLVSYIDGGPNEVRVFDLDGKPQKGSGRLALPPVATFANIVALPKGDALLTVSTYLRPTYYVRWAAANGQVEATGLAIESPIKFDDAEVVRAFAESADGTRVPLNIIRRKGVVLDGKNPVLQYGYGGYGISQQPHFAGAMVRLFLDGGGVYVEVNTRGGAEYGERWHDEGRLTKKQNVFDDFAAAAQYLIDAKYTDHGHLALRGGSNGGLLMGAMITQHPDLARAVVSSVGIYDMLRMELAPNGAFNVTEFGTVKHKKQFKALYAYSPYHHVVRDTKYPSLLLMTGANDGRVDPMHSRKFAAVLQAATSSSLPVLLRISEKSGHGIGSSLSEIIDERADVLAFLYDQLDMKEPARK